MEPAGEAIGVCEASKVAEKTDAPLSRSTAYRAELVVVWQAEPAATHPRLLERLRIAPGSLVVMDEGFEALHAGTKMKVLVDPSMRGAQAS